MSIVLIEHPPSICRPSFIVLIKVPSFFQAIMVLLIYEDSLEINDFHPQNSSHMVIPFIP